MAKRQRPRLGRGLSSLVAGEGEVAGGVGSASSEVEAKPVGEGSGAGVGAGEGVGGLEPSGGVGREVGVDEIVASPFQPRSDVDDSSLAGLAASIGRRGVMQPIVVRERPGWRDGGGVGGGGERWELVAGERRWRAARLAGLERVPAVVREFSDEEAAEAALVENVQRRDLNPVDRARALRSLGERFGLSHGEIASRVGLERSSVTNLIRITELEEGVLSLVASGRLSVGHAKALLGMEAGAGRGAMAERASEGGWSVRELERRVSASGPGDSGGGGSRNGRAGEARPAALEDLERRLGEHLGTRVRVRTRGASRSKGTIEVSFYDLDHFDGLMKRFGFDSPS